MLLRVVCPRCGLDIVALPQSAGKVGECACGGTFVVPTAAPGRPLSNRTAVLLVVAAVALGLAAGLRPGKRSASARQLALAPLAEGADPADIGAGGPDGLTAFRAGPEAPPRSPDVPRAPAPSSPGATPAPPLSARDLLLLYRDDPAGAEARYRGRALRVRGELTPPPAGAEDYFVAGLVTFGAEEVPPAAYPNPVPSRAGVLLRAAPSRQADFRSLPGGATVELEGRCAGWLPDASTHLGAVVVLEDCRLIRRPKK